MSLRVLPGISWLQLLRFEAEISAEEENSNSILPEDTKCSGGGLNGRDSAVETFRRAVTDREREPGLNSIPAIFQQVCSIVS